MVRKEGSLHFSFVKVYISNSFPPLTYWGFFKFKKSQGILVS